jgi:CBS domain containing-hemolysin-like protein
MSLFAFAVILLLILLNALYVAAEFSAVSVRRSRIQQKAEEGNKLAIRLFPYIQDGHRLDHYIATCQIGITISSLVLGAYGQTALAPVLTPLFQGWGGMQVAAAQSTAAVVILIALTAMQMILGELVPKSLALEFPTPVALFTVIPMQWSLRLLAWFIAVLNGSGIAILRLLGVPNTGHRHIHSPEELEYLIAESRDGGLFEPGEHERLRKALRLGTTRVEEIMVPRLEIRALNADTPFPEVLRIAGESPYTRLPVYRGTLDHMVGYLHVQDIARQALDANERMPLRPLLFLPGGLSLERVLTRLREERQHVALITDEFGGTAGLVTVGDILDELLGGVADEFKAEEWMPEPLPDGRVRLPGSLRLTAAAQHLGVHCEGESATLGGFVMERLGHVPQVGEQVVLGHIRLEVETMAGRRVASVLADSAVAAEVERG